MCAQSGAPSDPAASARSCAPLLLFEVRLNDVEHALPDRALVLDPGDRLVEYRKVQAEPVGTALNRADYHPRLLEHLQMPRDSRLGYAKPARCLPDGRAATSEPFYDPSADRMRQCPEGSVNHIVNNKRQGGPTPIVTTSTSDVACCRPIPSGSRYGSLRVTSGSSSCRHGLFRGDRPG